MIRRLSKVTGMMVGTAFGMGITVYGAGEVVTQCLLCILP